MEIHLNKLGKRFNKDWIFRNLDLKLVAEKSYAIVGPNGSGKSTLLKVLSGYLPPSSGSITYFQNNQKFPTDGFYKTLAFVAPYIEIIEELSLIEFLEFHFNFKRLRSGYSISDIIEILGLQSSSHKLIHDFSSGMKQRVKLGTAFYSEAEVIFLDEPTMNLDENGFKWFLDEINKLPKSSLILIASNQEKEYSWAKERINIQECKI